MRILAIDSSGLVATVAVLENDVLLAEYTTNYKITHSQTLLPMLDAIKNMIDLDLNTLDAIAVVKGPGSFTGLRIGSATAKGLAFALDKPIVEVSTLQGLAYNLCTSSKLICPIMDARRSQVYTGVYAFDTGEIGDIRIVMDQAAISISELMEKLDQIGQPVIFLGDGVPVFRSYIEEHLHVDFSFAPPHMNRQRAGAVAALGAKMFEKGICVNARDHEPEYLRLSQAERERMEQNSGQ